jgi:hypothetical protein
MPDKGKRQTVSLLAACGLALACVLPAISFAGDHAELVPVAYLPGGFGGYYPCGDGNHNGREETYGTWGRSLYNLLICENVEDDSFVCTSPGFRVGWVLDFGYHEGDSLAEIICGTDMDTLRLYRAVSRDSFPIHPVWEAYTPYQIQYARFCDLDHDGHQDIVASGRSGGLYVYENQCADSWVEVPFPQPHPWIMGTFAVGDFDSDGYTELAGGNDRGYLLVYECLGHGQCARACSLNYYPNEICDYDHAAANDMDRNGLPELISLFRRWNMPADSCMIRIYEEPEHNNFVCVDSLTYEYNPFVCHCVAAGDITGDGIDEFAVSTGLDVRLFQCSGLHQYTQTWQVNLGSVFWTEFFDINRDGREEVIITTSDTTFVYEDTSGLGSAVFEKLPRRRAISVQPTITRLGAPVVFSGISYDATVEIHGTDGRLVRRQPQVRQSDWTWDLRDQTGNLVPAGTYFAVIRNKGKSTSLKLCLVR